MSDYRIIREIHRHAKKPIPIYHVEERIYHFSGGEIKVSWEPCAAIQYNTTQDGIRFKTSDLENDYLFHGAEKVKPPFKSLKEARAFVKDLKAFIKKRNERWKQDGRDERQRKTTVRWWHRR